MYTIQGGRTIMKRLIALLCLLPLLLSGCTFVGRVPDEEELSKEILFSMDYNGAGYGTQAMCASAEVYVHTDGRISVMMPDLTMENIIEIASFQMSPEDYEELAAFASPRKIARLLAWDTEGCDGTTEWITLYTDGEDGTPRVLLRKGGYMPDGIGFQEMRSGIFQRLEKYGVGKTVSDWRQKLIDAEE